MNLFNNRFDCIFYSHDSNTNREKLFEEALKSSRFGKVLYILRNEIEELPQLSQDLSSVDKHYMKMISFLYARNLDSLLESVIALDTWQNVPSTIILDDLGEYFDKNEVQNACGIVAFLIDVASSCSVVLNTKCKLFISFTGETINFDSCNLFKELYGT